MSKTLLCKVQGEGRITLINMIRGNSWADETYVEGEESASISPTMCQAPLRSFTGKHRKEKQQEPDPETQLAHIHIRPHVSTWCPWGNWRTSPTGLVRMKEIHIRWCFHYRAWCLSFLISSLHLMLIFMRWVESKFYSWRNCNTDNVSRVTGAVSGGLGIQTRLQWFQVIRQTTVIERGCMREVR